MVKETVKDVKEQLDSFEEFVHGEFRTLDSKLIKNIDTIKELLESSMKTIGSDIKSVESNIKSAVEEVANRVATIEQRVSEVEKMSTENKAGTLKELYEMDEKRSNVVVFGIPEPVSSGEASPRDKDTKEVDSIFQAVTGQKKAFEIKFRIGKKQEGKARPIVVKLRDQNHKEEILNSSANLRNHGQWKDVYIRPDLTKCQREFIKKQEEELQAEAMRRNSQLKNGEDWAWGVRGKGMQRHLTKVKAWA